ncbi:ferrous iron transport protein B [Thermosyntropha lipolytica DSM 11003]|uniref:Ferrous iron transport protein B n=1 Tax=Thermosyntropha lipolytica DSM 11003 TaxID=1123382 RepID=A0A1M5ND53_9FIRM|nr:ferrous iron transport protein B [Thermosyntropha lipolytica]SHG87417.1 ferrous iron transport protein B [Thermosyntropha lipolytica DSM 11003]
MHIVMLGNPNVGKSSVLNRLTGSMVFISNYPGTSVDIYEASLQLAGRNFVIYDTPGIYSLFSAGEEQQVIKELLENKDIDLVLNIVDAANLERNLVLTLEIIETGLPVIVVLNQIDRARLLGLKIDVKMLEKLLKVPVISFSAATGEGLFELQDLLLQHADRWKKGKIKTDARPVQVINLDNTVGCSSEHCNRCSIPQMTCATLADFKRAEKAKTIVGMVVSRADRREKLLLDRIQDVVDKPVLGTMLLLACAYLAFLILLRFIELSEGPISLFLEPVNRFLSHFILQVMPEGMLGTILARAVPEGLIIPFTIIMPAMLMVSIIMSVIEDTGLLPRYSVALERIGSFFGVSGQAVIPLALGFGCRTPAVLATRIMPDYAQRFIVITLLSIVIPCAATLGILTSVISAFNASLLTIMLTMLTTLMVLGWILSRLNPREEIFIYELPPLRLPLWNNVWNKIKMRFSGFFTEILPLLLVMSIIIRALIESGVLQYLGELEEFSRILFGIPAEALVAVLITIFQRYLAPLVLLNLPLTPREATIAISMIALSLPCLPVMVMTIREIGVKGLIKIIMLGLLTSFTVGMVLNLILPA